MTQTTKSKRSAALGTSGQKSLRAVAREIGVSHSLLSKWKKGERKLKPEVEARYWEVVTTKGQNGDKGDWLESSHDEAATPTARVGEIGGASWTRTTDLSLIRTGSENQPIRTMIS